jgi:hypothetical protein
MLMSDPSQDPETLERRESGRERRSLLLQFKSFLGLIGALVLIALGIMGLVNGRQQLAEAGLIGGGIAAALFLVLLMVGPRRRSPGSR